MKTSVQLILPLCLLAVASCSGRQPSSVHHRENGWYHVEGGQADSLSHQDSLTRLFSENLWKEANAYKATLTDTTFLQTKGEMSLAAIDLMNGSGVNPHYAFNQVVYLKALDRARGRLSVRDGRLVFPCKSGKELNISDDLFRFIRSLFDDWNQWLDAGRHELV